MTAHGLSQAQVNERMRPWSDAEYRRFSFRASLFRRRGLTADQADSLADRLALRDQERDDRRVCLECKHLQQSGGCFAAAQGWIAGASKRLQPVVDILARCQCFEFQTP